MNGRADTMGGRADGRFYFRCLDCLSIVVLTDKFEANEALNNRIPCACGGEHWDFMGKVRGSSLVRTDEVIPCDERCVSAPGPNCSCKCGGQNHGTSITVSVTHTQEIPSLIKPLDDSAIKRGKEFREQLSIVEAMLRTRWPNDGKWLPRDVWEEKHEAFRKLSHAKHSKVHKSRMNDLEELKAFAAIGVSA